MGPKTETGNLTQTGGDAGLSIYMFMLGIGCHITSTKTIHISHYVALLCMTLLQYTQAIIYIHIYSYMCIPLSTLFHIYTTPCWKARIHGACLHSSWWCTQIQQEKSQNMSSNIFSQAKNKRNIHTQNHNLLVEHKPRLQEECHNFLPEINTHIFICCLWPLTTIIINHFN